MLQTVRVVVRDGKIERLEPIRLHEGVQVLMTVLTETDGHFWQAASESSLSNVWDNPEDDIYVELLAS